MDVPLGLASRQLGIATRRPQIPPLYADTFSTTYILTQVLPVVRIFDITRGKLRNPVSVSSGIPTHFLTSLGVLGVYPTGSRMPQAFP